MKLEVLLDWAASGEVESIKKTLEDGFLDQSEIMNEEGFSLLHIAAQNAQLNIVNYLLLKKADPNMKASKGQTPLQLASMKGDVPTVTLLIQNGAELNLKGFDGMTPIYAAALTNRSEVVLHLLMSGADPMIAANTNLNALEIAIKRGHVRVVDTFKYFLDGAKSPNEENSNQMNLPELQKKVARSLYGLIGLDNFSKNFAFDLFDFMQANESRIRMFWGSHGTGKSELGLRFGGQINGVPRLSYNHLSAFYLSATEEGIDFNVITDKADPHSVVFIDDADKLFDANIGLKDTREIVKFQQSLNTSVIRKPIYWILAGNFENAQSAQKLELLFGKSLAHKIDYIDWKLPSWTLENILRAVKQVSSRRGLTYEDEALFELCKYCLSHGAVIAFDLLDQTLYRRHGGKEGLVTADEARELISSLSTS